MGRCGFSVVIVMAKSLADNLARVDTCFSFGLHLFPLCLGIVIELLVRTT